MADHRGVAQTGHSSRQLGRYELIAEIASGGMGTVLLARLAGVGGFQRLFAVKLLHKAYAQDHEFVEMLLDEARIAALIHHPNVVSIQEVAESPEHGYYLVMDYVEGFPLWDLGHAMKSAPPQVRWRVVMRAAVDALNGLEAAHTATDEDGRPLGVVHRDISPQNILVSVNGIGRVTDFGIAKAAARITTTRVGQVKGKLAYMSPEQARGRNLDLRTDLWAMGVVIWEQLTGTRLFKVEVESETYNRVLNAPIQHLRDLIPQTPPDIDAVIARALERDVNKRWSSAREMVTALERAARAHNLLADSHETGEFLRTTFQSELALRRAAIKQAAAQHTIAPGQRAASLPGGLVVPQLPEQSVSLTVSPPPGPPPVPLPTPSQDDYEESMDTVVVPPEKPNIDELSTFKVNRAESSPAVQKALEHARAVMSHPGTEPIPQRPSGPIPGGPPPRPSSGNIAAVDPAAQGMQPGSAFAGPRMPTVQLPATRPGAPVPAASVTPAPATGPAGGPQPRSNTALWIVVVIVALVGGGVVVGLQLGWFPMVARGHATTPAAMPAPPPTRAMPVVPARIQANANVAGGALPAGPPPVLADVAATATPDAAANPATPAPVVPPIAPSPSTATPDAAAAATDAAGALPAAPAAPNEPTPAPAHHHHSPRSPAMSNVPPA
jgi:serine/threonine-protein kinase